MTSKNGGQIMAEMSRNKHQLLRIGEASKLIGVSIKTLRRWDDKGFLKAIRINPKGNRLYKREDILKAKEGSQK